MQFRKLICILLLICCTFLPPSALALQSGEFTYEVLDGNVYITRYACSDGAVVIPETIDGMPVVSIEDSAFSYCRFVTKVIIPNNVSRIGAVAF